MQILKGLAKISDNQARRSAQNTSNRGREARPSGRGASVVSARQDDAGQKKDFGGKSPCPRRGALRARFRGRGGLLLLREPLRLLASVRDRPFGIRDAAGGAEVVRPSAPLHSHCRQGDVRFRCRARRPCTRIPWPRLRRRRRRQPPYPPLRRPRCRLPLW